MAHSHPLTIATEQLQLFVRDAEDVREPEDRRELTLVVAHERDLRGRSVVIAQVHVVCDHGVIIAFVHSLEEQVGTRHPAGFIAADHDKKEHDFS